MVDPLGRSAPAQDEVASFVSRSCSKPANMPHWLGFSSQACSRTPHLYLHWPDLPELHVSARQIDTDGQYVVVQSRHESDYIAIRRQQRNKPEDEPLDPLGPERVREPTSTSKSA